MEYILCHTCTCAVEYCDYSAFAFDPAKELKVIEWVELVGMITHVRELKDSEEYYGDCNACEDDMGEMPIHLWSKD